MVSIRPVNIFDGKVINDQDKGDWSGIMFPQARGDGAGAIPMGSQEALELIVCKPSGLRQAIHAFAHLSIDMPIVDETV